MESSKPRLNVTSVTAASTELRIREMKECVTQHNRSSVRTNGLESKTTFTYNYVVVMLATQLVFVGVSWSLIVTL